MKFIFTAIFFLALFYFPAKADLIPIEAFGNLPESHHVTLSPDGKNLAYIQEWQGNSLLSVVNLATREQKFLARTDNKKFKIGWYRWANNETILISADYPVFKSRVKYTEARLMKVDISGNSVVEPVIRIKSDENNPQFQNNIIDMLPDEPNHFLMSLDLEYPNKPGVYKIDINSVRVRKLIQRGKSHIRSWMTDRQHRVRLGFGRDDTKIFYRLIEPETGEIRNIWEYEIFDAPDITPLGFGLNPNHLYIRAEHQQRYAVFKVDLSTDELERTLIYSDPKYDVEGSLIYSKVTNDVVGVYHGEADNAKVFFDPKLEKFQSVINKAIPDSYNNISSMSDDEDRYILYSSNSKMPGAYYLGDKKKNGLEIILERYPMLFNKPLSGKTKVHYKASDGTALEAYVTEPHKGATKTNAAIVIPHGGPMSRNYSGFDWFSEFFASRGYTIIEPNFRGSTGYGHDFAMASIKQWGGQMQTDLSDSAKWLAKNYPIDLNKICIVGGSYGGYAAQMAAAKQNDVFKCAASIAGVSDLEVLVVKARRFSNYEVVKKQIGTDDDVLEANSPVNLAKQVSIPVLLIHGEDDRVVDVSHSRNMAKALENAKKDVKYVELENGNHYLEIEQNRLKTLSLIEKFLERSLQDE